jgi:arsenate reductase-like glutaredoxin family protein
VRDFFADRFSEDELRGIFGDRPASEFFSWVSPSFRKLGVSRKSLSDDQLIALMLEQPRLIRRPLIVVSGELLTPKGGGDRIILALEDLV